MGQITMKSARQTCARRGARSLGRLSARKVRAAASIRDRRSPAHEVAASKPLEKEEAVGAPNKSAVMSGAALAAVSALAATPAVAEMPSPAGTMGGALPALATILFVFIP